MIRAISALLCKLGRHQWFERSRYIDVSALQAIHVDGCRRVGCRGKRTREAAVGEADVYAIDRGARPYSGGAS